MPQHTRARAQSVCVWGEAAIRGVKQTRSGFQGSELAMVLAAFVLASLSFSTPRIGRAPRMALDAGNPVALESDAAAMLEEANGDANKARMNFIGYTMAFIQEEQPDVYEALTKNPERPDCHEALVEITWDSIAAFCQRRIPPHPHLVLQNGSSDCSWLSMLEESVSVLDIGCGNGLLLPFLSTRRQASPHSSSIKGLTSRRAHD